MLHLQRRTLDAVGAARLRSGVGHVETVGVMDGYGSYPYYSSTKIRKLHLCYAKNVHQPWPLALKCVCVEVGATLLSRFAVVVGSCRAWEGDRRV